MGTGPPIPGRTKRDEPFLIRRNESEGTSPPSLVELKGTSPPSLTKPHGMSLPSLKRHALQRVWRAAGPGQVPSAQC